jgi:hypothetical protein
MRRLLGILLNVAMAVSVLLAVAAKLLPAVRVVTGAERT